MKYNKVLISCVVLVIFMAALTILSRINVNNSDPKIARVITSLKSLQSKMIPDAHAIGSDHDDVMKYWYFFVVGWSSVDRFVADNAGSGCTADNYDNDEECDSIGIAGLLGRYGTVKGLVPDMLDIFSAAVEGAGYSHVCSVPSSNAQYNGSLTEDGETTNFTLGVESPQKSSPASYSTNGGNTYDKRFTLTVPVYRSTGILAAVEFYCTNSESAPTAGYLMVNFPEGGQDRTIETYYDTQNPASKVAEFYMSYDNNSASTNKQRFALKMEINATATTFKYHLGMVNQSGANAFNATKMHAIGNYTTNNYKALLSYIGGAHTTFNDVGGDANADSVSTTHDDADYSMSNGEIMVICLTGGTFSQNLTSCSGLTLEPTPTSGLALSNSAKLTLDYIGLDTGLKADIYTE
jgi:hypothetical protein